MGQLPNRYHLERTNRTTRGYLEEIETRNKEQFWHLLKLHQNSQCDMARYLL